MATARTKTPTAPKKTATQPAAARAPRPPAPKKAAPASGPDVGDKAPPFALLDASGARVTSRSLSGKPYVLFFYPRDNTPGCTQEACAFRDHYRDLQKLGVEVLGVSPDSIKSHEGFIAKHELPFRLLADDAKELATAYGVWALKKNYGREFMGIVRSTFLVDRGGKIAHVWRGVRVSGHVEAVIDEAKKVSRS
jgi:thioredoxin-dependent peroxiredoxin